MQSPRNMQPDSKGEDMPDDVDKSAIMRNDADE